MAVDARSPARPEAWVTPGSEAISGSHEYKLHKLVSELIVILEAPSNKMAELDVLVKVLNKNRTPYITTQISAHTARRKIVEFTSKGGVSRGEEFLSKYNELKIRQARDLDPLVYLLSKMTEDVGLLSHLHRIYDYQEEEGREDLSNSKVLDIPDGAQVLLPKQGEALTREQLLTLKETLSKVATNLQDKAVEEVKKKPPEEMEGIPQLPVWASQRPYLSSDFTDTFSLSSQPGSISKHLAPPTKEVVPLGSLSKSLQEAAIIRDLLDIMTGVSGRYIRSNQLPVVPTDGYGGTFAGHRTFTIDPSLDEQQVPLVTRLLPLATDYSTVVSFMEGTNYYYTGLVNQALAGAMRGVVKEYRLVLAQLETEYNRSLLTLQKLLYYLQPCLATLGLLALIATAIGKGRCRGGKTLSTIHKLATGYSGDGQSQQLFLHLVTAACVPYFKMLKAWLFNGEVNDPYQEFMVVEETTIVKDRLKVDYNDKYWERKYTLTQESIPSFLEQLAEKILYTGKYLNVLSECGHGADYSGPTHLSYQQEEGGYMDTIHAAYAFASRGLLELIMREHDLLGHLRSIKHYFLVDQGDLLVHFLDMAGDELSCPVGEVLPSRLESLLELALRTSLADHDRYKDNVYVKLWNFDLVSQLLLIIDIQPQKAGHAPPPPSIVYPEADSASLSGMEAFCLDYKVKWPLSLVISRKCLYRYQMLFRHLFFCRHVERQLCATWISCKSTKNSALDANSWYASAFALLQRMLNYVQNLQYYETCEVLEPLWVELEAKLRSSTTIEDVLKSHSDFLDTCLRDCMLSQREVLSITSRLLATCLSFTRHVQQAMGQKVSHPYMKSGRACLLSEDNERGGVADRVKKSEARFERELVRLLDWLYNQGPPAVKGMVARLDFNGFYQHLYRLKDTPITPTGLP